MSQNAELSKGLVFHAPLDEWNGTTDLVSKVVGTPTAIYPVLNRQGSGRRWLDFDGVNDYVTLPTLPAFGSSDFSIVVKIKTGAIGELRSIVGSITNGFSFYVYTDGTLNAERTNVAGVSNHSTGVLSANTTYTVGYTRSGTTGTYYINGIASGTCTDSQNYIQVCSLMGTYDGAGGFWNGSISLLRIFNYALTPTQITNYSKPEYPIEWVDRGATGVNLVTNGDMSSSTGWSINGDHTAITGGKFVMTANNYPGAYQEGIFDVNKYYNVLYTIDSISSGYIIVSVGNAYSIVGSTTGLKNDSHIKPSDANLRCYSQLGTTTTLTMDNLSVVQAGCILDLNAEGLARYSDGSYNVGYWTDKTNSLTATINGATVVIPPASNLGSTFFNGSTGKVEFTGMNGLTGDITISCRVNILRFLTRNDILKTASGLYLFIHSTGSVYMTRDGVSGTLVTSGAEISINTNYNIIITSTAAGITNFYINNVLKGTANQAAAAPVSDTTWYIGSYGTSLSESFMGNISDIHIHSRILSADERQLIYDSNS